jgi:hypothetical protein
VDEALRADGDRPMRLGLKGTSLLILAVTAGACSRLMFAAFHDTEGPNLVVVAGMTAILFLISAAAYLSNVLPSLTGFKRSAAAIAIQVVVPIGLFLALR